MKFRFVFRVRETTMSYHARPEVTRIVEVHSKDEEGYDLMDSVKALEYARRLAKERGWELLVVEQIR